MTLGRCRIGLVRFALCLALRRSTLPRHRAGTLAPLAFHMVAGVVHLRRAPEIRTVGVSAGCVDGATVHEREDTLMPCTNACAAHSGAILCCFQVGAPRRLYHGSIAARIFRCAQHRNPYGGRSRATAANRTHCERCPRHGSRRGPSQRAVGSQNLESCWQMRRDLVDNVLWAARDRRAERPKLNAGGLPKRNTLLKEQLVLRIPHLTRVDAAICLRVAHRTVLVDVARCANAAAITDHAREGAADVAELSVPHGAANVRVGWANDLAVP
mmetsp:Transcript_41360/g.114009  ORF Transcript_41360/g.114009 Transcript_41360/m.114009 type:complete len:270 (-) Transcript_41360:164-973(-)